MRLLVGTRDSLHVGEFDTDMNVVVPLAGRRVAGLGAFLTSGESVLVRGEEGVRAFDPSLRHGTLLPLETFASGVRSGSHLLLAVAGEVVTLDRDLSEVGRIGLGVGGKTAHECMLVGPYVYVLDNVVTPAYVLLLNATNPRSLEVLSKDHIYGVYCHLDSQFVDLSEHLWIVVQSTTHEGGSGQYLHWYSADSGQSLGEPVQLYFNTVPGMAGSPGDEHGPSQWRYSDQIAIGSAGENTAAQAAVRIHGSSSVTPCWIVVSATSTGYYDRPFYLCRLSVRGGTATLDRFVQLSFSGEAGKIVVRRFQQWTIVLAEVFSRGEGRRASSLRMIVIDTEGDGRVLFDGPLSFGSDNAGEIGLNDFQVWETGA